MKTEANINRIQPQYTQTIWVRGVELTIEAYLHQITIHAGSLLLEQHPITELSDEIFRNWVYQYKKICSQRDGSLLIPQARSNIMDEFVYRSEDGSWQVKSGYAQFEWDESDLTSDERASGYFFLTHTNETLGTLMAQRTYTVIRYPLNGQPDVQVGQLLSDIVKHAQSEAWMKDYLAGQLFIFDEKKQVQLAENEWQPIWVATLNENSAYLRLPTPLTPELKSLYLSKQELRKQFGYDVSISKAVPSGYTVKQNKKGELKCVYYYHSDLIPQYFLCKCGKKTQTTGCLENRICWDCLNDYRNHCFNRSQSQFDIQRQAHLGLEPVFVAIHTNQSQKGQATCREILQLCVMDHRQNVLFKSFIRINGTLSMNNQERGYQPEWVEQAPEFKAIQQAFHQAIQGKLVVIYNANDRLALYHQLCQEAGIEAIAFPHVLCLKEILIPLTNGAKRYRRIKNYQEKQSRDLRQGLELECEACGIPFSDEFSIEKDAWIMSQLYARLNQKVDMQIAS